MNHESANTTAVSANDAGSVFRWEPRCRVCRNDRLRQLVNHGLALWLPHTHILRELQRAGVADGITYHSIRRHAERHFPIKEFDLTTLSQRDQHADPVECAETAVRRMKQRRALKTWLRLSPRAFLTAIPPPILEAFA